MTPNSRPRMAYLEAARGIASIIVLVHHFLLAFAPDFKHQIDGSIFAFAVNGEAAVGFFFVLSGLVLVQKFYRTHDYVGILAATIKRLPRLMLPAAVSILVSYVILRLSWNFNIAAAAISGSSWLRGYGTEAFDHGIEPSLASALQQCMLVFLDSTQFFYNTNLWTMKPELFGSFLAFAMAALTLGNLSLWLKHAILIAVSLTVFLVTRQLFPFAVGCYLAFLFVAYNPRVVDNLFFGVSGIVIAALLFSTHKQNLHTLGGAMIISTLIMTPRIAIHLSGKVGKFLGEISFPLYLVHVLVMMSFTSYLFVKMTPIYGNTSTIFACLFATIIVSVLAALPIMKLERLWVPFLGKIVSHLVRRWSKAIPGSSV